MDIDALKTQWSQMDARLDALELANAQNRHEDALRRAQAGERRLRREPAIELAAFAGIGAWAMHFLVSRAEILRGEPVLALPAVLLWLVSIALVIANGRQLAVLAKVDYSGSLIEAQAQLARYRSLRVKCTLGLLLGGVALWVLVPVLLGQALAHPATFLAWNRPWLAANLALGVVLGGAFVVLAPRIPALSRFAEALGGEALQDAETRLAELREFSRQA